MTLQLTDLNKATLPQLKELIDSMESGMKLVAPDKKNQARELIGKVIDIYCIKRFGKTI